MRIPARSRAHILSATDQVLSSSSSLSVLIAGLLVLELESLGTLSLAILAQGIVVLGQREILGQAMSLDVSRAGGEVEKVLIPYLRCSVLFSLAAIFAAIVALVVGAPWWLVASCVSVGLTIIQDLLRVHSIAAGSYIQAIVSDGLWLFVMAGLFSIFGASGSSLDLVLWINATGVLVALAVLWFAKRPPLALTVRPDAKVNQLWRPYAVEYVVASLPYQGLTLCLPVVMPLSEVGLLRLALSCTSFLTSFLSVFRIRWFVRFGSIAILDRRRVVRLAWVLSGLIATVFLVLAVVASFLPDALVGQLIEPEEANLQVVLALAFVYEGVRAGSLPMIDCVRTMATGRIIVLTRMTYVTVGCTALSGGAVGLGSAIGVLIVLTGGQVVGFVLYALRATLLLKRVEEGTSA